MLRQALPSGRDETSRLAEPVQLENLMGVDCRPEFIFGVSISSVSIWMVHLQHLLVASSNLLRRRVLRKAERFEGFCFQYLEPTSLKISFRCLMLSSNLACVKGFCRTGANGRRKRHLCRLINAGPPRLTAAVCCFPLIAGRHWIRQIAREIISLIVFPRMLRAEHQVQSLRISPDGRTIGAAAFATVPLAFRLVRLAERSRFFARWPQADENLRIKCHRALYGGLHRAGKQTIHEISER
ncbi:hypothetical protein DLJ82_5378 (plasmid) [Rhizobium leguminosarum]|uniref:Uncharacterized protein n=1 Tax=Rhizobium leguminosarum TaxID=384 RepID=A0A2Z4YPJ8_RHILE|nr:hypothetical protein DLJ82_5378 [Rhizobium leguminosarum]